MTTYIASTKAEAVAMISVAKGGDTVLLAAGTYDNMKLIGIHETGVVKIGSLDPDNQAVITGLTINDSSGMKFSNIDFQTSTSRTFSVYGSDTITFDNIDVHGILDGSSQDDDTNGLLIRNSTNVAVTNSHFHELLEGVTHLDSSNVTISGNEFNLIGNNAIDGGGTSQIQILNNTFTDFDHVGTAVHPDMIQFWTTATTTAASDITISGNVFDRGTGAAVQGIWMNDDVNHLPYENVTITNNTLVGASFNAIVISGGVNATVTDNVVIGTQGQQSWIGMFDVGSVTLADNIATSYNFQDSDVTGTGDVQARVLALNEDGSYPSWLSGPLVPGAGASDQAQADILSRVSLVGYTDGASETGQTYGFDTIPLMGTEGADRLGAASAGSYHIYGYGGNDTLTGNAAGLVNTLEGGTGNDTYTVTQSIDVVVEKAGEGTDTIVAYADYTLSANVENMRAGTGNIRLDGNALNNSMVASTGASLMYGHDGNDSMVGSTGSDRFYGGNGNDVLNGNDGWDVLDGGEGNDTLSGGTGNDTIVGGAGNDTIQGGAGADTLTGGLGADTFIYRGADLSGAVASNTDTIKDFNAAQGDKISLSLVDGNTLTSADNAFKFIGSQTFHGVAGELRWAVAGDGITVYADDDGDKVADFAIHLSGLSSIAASSFML